MRDIDKVDLNEAVYKRPGKVIKRNDHKRLANERIAELRAIDTSGYSKEELGIIEAEIVDLEFFISKEKWD